MEENNHLVENKMVEKFVCNGKNITLIGTAHVSKESAELVKEVIHRDKPDTVCVELCATRLKSIRDSDSWRNMDIVKVIREKKSMFLLINLMLASFQKRIAQKFDIKPGQEMINAIEAATIENAQIIPADREVQITITRVWRSMGFWEKIKLMFQLILSLFSSEDITEEEIEKMKQEDILQTLLADVKKEHPIMERVLIDERDQYLAKKIRTAPGEKIVAVVGAGHLAGIKRYIGVDNNNYLGEGVAKQNVAENNKSISSYQDIDISKLEELPEPDLFTKTLKWLIPLSIIFLFAAGFFMKGTDTGTDMVWLWIGINGLFAGIGSLVALAHPYSIISAMVAAPITILHPMIAAGWVSGLVEAITRKPKVRDLESIPIDIMSVRGFWRNSVTRILLVVVFTNIGATIGAFTAIPIMLKIIN
ncbi:MAG: TraB/GumN family protein [Desulfamplus sp.]|nr:TraB/GumN family protein [Desulfamplus sp.]